MAAFFFFERSKDDWVVEPGPVLQLLGVGVTATIGQLFLTLAFTRGEPAKVSVVGLTQIVFTLILDTAILRHTLETSKLIGVPLVLAPTAWLMLRQARTRPEAIPQEPLDTPA